MDTGDGYFEKIPEDIYKKAEEKWPMESGVFKVGEEIEVKGSLFRVHAIKPRKLILKLLKRDPKE